MFFLVSNVSVYSSVLVPIPMDSVSSGLGSRVGRGCDDASRGSKVSVDGRRFPTSNAYRFHCFRFRKRTHYHLLELPTIWSADTLTGGDPRCPVGVLSIWRFWTLERSVVVMAVLQSMWYRLPWTALKLLSSRITVVWFRILRSEKLSGIMWMPQNWNATSEWVERWTLKSGDISSYKATLLACAGRIWDYHTWLHCLGYLSYTISGANQGRVVVISI